MVQGLGFRILGFGFRVLIFMSGVSISSRHGVGCDVVRYPKVTRSLKSSRT